jgi:hypothetical protein
VYADSLLTDIHHHEVVLFQGETWASVFSVPKIKHVTMSLLFETCLSHGLIEWIIIQKLWDSIVLG